MLFNRNDMIESGELLLFNKNAIFRLGGACALRTNVEMPKMSRFIICLKVKCEQTALFIPEGLEGADMGNFHKPFDQTALQMASS